ncbi:hypothetical protein HK100_004999 [Physocladia obscura]|uniref:Uncharacterized protein n=1 Tax=Physocladia obscura TaxID=109957 RepID=A0AAD5SXU5_9FUNG|nr:hypothetical protein HK100_004999 [Physocladia obscura]
MSEQGQKLDIEITGTGHKLGVHWWGNSELGNDADVEWLVVVVHGVKRRMLEPAALRPTPRDLSAGSESQLQAATWRIYAPEFAHASRDAQPLSSLADLLWSKSRDKRENTNANSHFVWTRAGVYADGSAPDNSRDPALTGHVLMDVLLTTLVRKHPNAKHVRLVGFSAGAQFFQRYCALSKTLDSLRSEWKTLRVFLGTASSWLYLDHHRLNHSTISVDTITNGNIPLEFLPLPGGHKDPLNKYKFGLYAIPNPLNPSNDSIDTIRARLLSYKTTFILVDDDIHFGPSLDVSSPALAQCQFHRYARSLVYLHYLSSYFPDSFASNINTVAVTNCGHDGAKVYAQTAVHAVIWGL